MTNFWEKKLAGEPVNSTPILSRNLFDQYTPTVPASITVPASPAYQPSNVTAGSYCPSCHSDSYISRHTNGAALSCSACGYNPNFEHIGKSLAAMNIPVVDAQRAKQVPSAGFNMQGEFAKLNAQARINATSDLNN